MMKYLAYNYTKCTMVQLCEMKIKLFRGVSPFMTNQAHYFIEWSDVLMNVDNNERDTVLVRERMQVSSCLERFVFQPTE